MSKCASLLPYCTVVRSEKVGVAQACLASRVETDKRSTGVYRFRFAVSPSVERQTTFFSRDKKVYNLVLFTVYSRSVPLPFGFHSLVAIRCIPFRSRDTPTAKGQKRARFAVYSGSQTRSDHREKMNQGDIASTQLLEALPSHKNPWLPRAPAENLRHAAKHRKWNATERNENGKSTALNETERNWKRFFLISTVHSSKSQTIQCNCTS